ncbi:stomatin-like protein 2, partial [Plakobranchus ocellatus]
NVTLTMDAVLYLRVIDPYKASYGVEDPEYAITQLAQTTMRSEIGRISLDTVFRERESLNIAIVGKIIICFIKINKTIMNKLICMFIENKADVVGL